MLEMNLLTVISFIKYTLVNQHTCFADMCIHVQLLVSILVKGVIAEVKDVHI